MMFFLVLSLCLEVEELGDIAIVVWTNLNCFSDTLRLSVCSPVREDIIGVDVVLVEQGLHPRALDRRHPDAERREHIKHHLEVKISKLF